MTSARLPSWARPSEILDLTRLALPVAMSRAAFMLMSLTDAILLGRYAAGELPYVLNGWLPIGVMFGFGMGLMIGVQVLTAELNGSGKGEETGRIFRRGLLVALCYGVLAMGVCIAVARPLLGMFGFDDSLADVTAHCTQILAYGAIAHMGGLACQFYLEALRRPNIATGINMIAVVFNLVMGLMLVPEHGAIGVVWSTTASRWFCLVLFLIAAWRLTPAFKPSPRGPAEEFKRQNMVGVGTGVANVAEWGSFNMTFVIATLVSIDAGTVYGLSVQMMGVIFMIYVGLGTATSVRVAEYHGRGDVKGVQDASRLGVAASVAIGLIMALLLIGFRNPVAVESLNGAEVQSAGAHLVPLLSMILAAVAFVTMFDGLQAVGSMALRAQGVVWIPTAIHVGSYVGVMLPLCVWFAFTPETAPPSDNLLAAIMFWPAHWPGAMGLGVWGVIIGISVASIFAGLGQVVALEIKSARGVRLGPPAEGARKPAPVVH